MPLCVNCFEYFPEGELKGNSVPCFVCMTDHNLLCVTDSLEMFLRFPPCDWYALHIFRIAVKSGKTSIRVSIQEWGDFRAFQVFLHAVNLN